MSKILFMLVAVVRRGSLRRQLVLVMLVPRILSTRPGKIRIPGKGRGHRRGVHRRSVGVDGVIE